MCQNHLPSSGFRRRSKKRGCCSIFVAHMDALSWSTFGFEGVLLGSGWLDGGDYRGSLCWMFFRFRFRCQSFFPWDRRSIFGVVF